MKGEIQVPVKNMSSPTDARINAPLDLEMTGGSPSPSCASSNTDFELDDMLADEESARRKSGECSSDSLTRFMIGKLRPELGRRQLHERGGSSRDEVPSSSCVEDAGGDDKCGSRLALVREIGPLHTTVEPRGHFVLEDRHVMTLRIEFRLKWERTLGVDA